MKQKFGDVYLLLLTHSENNLILVEVEISKSLVPEFTTFSCIKHKAK